MSPDESAREYYYTSNENRYAKEYIAEILAGVRTDAGPLEENAIVCPTRVDHELIDGSAAEIDKKCEKPLTKPLLSTYNGEPGPRGIEFPLEDNTPDLPHRVTVHRNGCIHYHHKSVQAGSKFFAPDFAQRLESLLQGSEEILAEYECESRLLTAVSISGKEPIYWNLDRAYDRSESRREYPGETVQKFTTMKELHENHEKVAESITNMLAGQWRQNWSPRLLPRRSGIP